MSAARSRACKGRVSDFVVAAAEEAAYRAVEEAQIIRLSIEDQRAIAEAIQNPPPLAPRAETHDRAPWHSGPGNAVSGSFAIEPLQGAHGARLVSGVDALDRYFREQVTQDIRRRLTNCFVAVDAAGGVVGFYTFAATSLPMTDLGPEEIKRLPRYPLLPARGLIGHFGRCRSGSRARPRQCVACRCAVAGAAVRASHLRASGGREG